MKIEGFRVVFKHPSGRKVRSDTTGLVSYPYARRARDSSVAEWRNSRFNGSYPEYQVDVLDGAGDAVHGRTLLSTVRGTYDS